MVKHKRIGIDARFMLRPLRGIPLYVTRLCQHLPALNRNYQFCLFINKGYEYNDKPENYQPRLAEILSRHHNVRIINHNDEAEVMWEQVYLPRLIKEHKIDLLHMPANRICFCPGIPTVITVHDVMEYLFLLNHKYPIHLRDVSNPKMLFYNARMQVYVRAVYKIGFKKAKKIITVSQHSAVDMSSKLKLSRERIEVIHHGIDECFFKSSPSLERRRFALMLGGDSYQKNPEGSIAAWAKVSPDIRRKYPLKVIGFCGKDNSPLKAAIKRYGLSNEIEIRGWVTEDDIIYCFQNAALFLFLSRYEGFGFPLLQAMASGTPIVSSNKASLPEVLGNTGLQFDSDAHDEIAKGIEKLLSDNPLWAEQSQAGIKRAKLFTWNSSAQAHLKVYEEILKAK